MQRAGADLGVWQVEYEFPASVPISSSCRDLLCRILVADPNRRITIPEIQRHPWYRTVRTHRSQLCQSQLPEQTSLP